MRVDESDEGGEGKKLTFFPYTRGSLRFVVVSNLVEEVPCPVSKGYLSKLAKVAPTHMYTVHGTTSEVKAFKRLSLGFCQ